MMPSVLASLIEAFNSFTTTGTTAIAYQQVVPGARFVHSLRLEPAGAYDASQPDLPKVFDRLVCQVIVSSLPDNALTEARQDLLELYEYYGSLNKNAELPPATLPPFTARVGTSHPRPDIKLEE
jgi:hypothetical protein